MNWIALGHIVKAVGYAVFKEEDEDENDYDSVPTKSHTQRQRRAKPATKKKVSSKPCCTAKR